MSPEAGKEVPVCEPGESRPAGAGRVGGCKWSVWAAKGLQGLLTTPIFSAAPWGCPGPGGIQRLLASEGSPRLCSALRSVREAEEPPQADAAYHRWPAGREGQLPLAGPACDPPQPHRGGHAHW